MNFCFNYINSMIFCNRMCQLNKLTCSHLVFFSEREVLTETVEQALEERKEPVHLLLPFPSALQQKP